MDQGKTVKCDLLVVGSGAGALSTAVTARLHGLNVIVTEKEPVFGGATARSGGALWVPNNMHAKKAGIQDSPEKVRTYLKNRTGNHFFAARVDAFIENAPKMVKFFEENTHVHWEFNAGMSDYYPDTEGGMPRGRTINTLPYDARKLGHEVKRLRDPLKVNKFMGAPIGIAEAGIFLKAGRSFAALTHVLKVLAISFKDHLTNGRAMRIVNGNALVAQLARTLMDKDVPIWTSSPAKELIVEGGAVKGAVIEHEGQHVRVEAARGVVLATGGFPHDMARRAGLFPPGSSPQHWMMLPTGNQGDGLKLAESANARIYDNLPRNVALAPITIERHQDGTEEAMPFVGSRAKPGFIAVKRNGKRFVNEANSYHAYGHALIEACRGEPEIVSWVICDHPALRKYGLGFAKPWPLPYADHIVSGHLIKGNTLRELAQNCGIDPPALEATVAAYNIHAKDGKDPEFGKGTNAYNTAMSDPDGIPSPCNGPIETGPFYAVKCIAAAVGTFAGMMTDEKCRVLDKSGNPIPGLYAGGNDNVSIMGGDYNGGGVTLGPAMTFGFIAGRHAAGVNS